MNIYIETQVALYTGCPKPSLSVDHLLSYYLLTINHKHNASFKALPKESYLSYLHRKFSSPKPLSITTQESISIFPKQPNLSCKNHKESIQELPEPVYSLALIKACSAHQSALSPDELRKFDIYCKWREKNGKPVF